MTTELAGSQIREYTKTDSCLNKLISGIKEVINPPTIGVILQNFREYATRSGTARLKEAERVYSMFLKEYRNGIKNYMIYAKSHGKEFSGTLSHPNYPFQELVVAKDECKCIYSTVKRDSNGFLQGDCVEVLGTRNGARVYSVEFSRWKDSVEVQRAFIIYDQTGKASVMTIL